MKFHEIMITNVKSLVGTYCLSFEDVFPDSNLFLIYGENGSGKTTIFDCLCLVLFDQTPNFVGGYKGEQTSNDSKAHIVNKTQTYACIELKFSIKDTSDITKRKYYHVTWGITRASNSLDKLLNNPFRSILETDAHFQPLQTLFQGTAVNPCKEVISKILLGLTYEDFVKSVLLPQGEWSAFLRQPSSERIDTLEKITDTLFFTDILERIGKKKSIAKEKLDQIQGMIQKIPSQESYQAALTENQELAQNIQFYNDVIDVADEWAEVDKGFAKIENIRQNISRHEGKKESQELFLQKAMENSLLEKQKREGIQHQQQVVSQIREEIETESQNILDVCQSLEYLTLQTKSISKDLQQKQKEFDSIVIPTQAFNGLQKAQDVYDSRCQDLKQIGIDIDLSSAQIRQNIRMREKGIQSHKDIFVELEHSLVDLQKSYINQQHYEQLFREVQNSQQNIQKDFDNCTNIVQQLDQEISLLEQKIYTTKLEMKNIVLRQDLIALKHQNNILLGESSEIPCPVCGATEHPYLDGEPVKMSKADIVLKKKLQQQEQEILQCKRTKESESKRALQLQQKVVNEESRLQNGIAKLEEIRLEIQKKSDSIEKILKPLVKNSLSYEQTGICISLERFQQDIETVLALNMKQCDFTKSEHKNRIFEKMQRSEINAIIRKKIVAEESQCAYLLQLTQDWDVSLDNLAKEKIRYEKLHLEKERQQLLKEELVVLNRNIKQNQEQIQLLQQDIFAAFVMFVDRLQSFYEKQNLQFPQVFNWIQNARNDRKFSEQRIHHIRNIFVSLVSKLETQYTTCVQTIASLSEQQQQFQKTILQIEKEIAFYIESTQELVVLEQKQTELFQKSIELRDREAPFQMFHSDLTPEDCRTIICDHSNIHRTERYELQQTIIKNQTIIDAHLVGQHIIQQEQKAHTHHEHWKELYGLVKGNNGKMSFRAFVQAIQLEKLLTITNQKLEILSSSYRVTPLISEHGFPSLDFQVYASDGIVRPLRTLSNGEEFVVALAMALALAEMRAVYTPIETLLIDEGFGSLDFQNVELVVQALSSLQLQDIQVGLISHVQSLIENIDHKIRVDDLLDIERHKINKDLPISEGNYKRWVKALGMEST